MKVIGIVAEYNPLHNGHVYQLNFGHQRLNADLIVVIMSGNFVQRGQPAIVDKWTRAEAALKKGANLIIELPIYYALQSADLFAEGSVRILNDLGVSDLLFGVENGDASEYESVSKWLVQNEKKLKEHFHGADRTQSYASFFQTFIQQELPNTTFNLNSPNNILALSYAKAINQYQLNISLAPLVRYKAHYHDEWLDKDSSIASASAIRKSIVNQQKVQAYLPKEMDISPSINPSSYWPFLKYRLLSDSSKELDQIFQMEPGFAYRMREVALKVNTLDEFLKKVKPKHLSQTRIERLLMYVLLNISKVQMKNKLSVNPPIRLLGFDQTGRDYLNKRKKSLKFSLVTNITQNNKDHFDMDIKAGQFYNMLRPLDQLEPQDLARKPLIYIDNKIISR